MKNLFKFFSVAIVVMTAALTIPQTAHAETAGSSAALITPIELRKNVEDARVKRLQSFLEKRNSPLAPYAKVFVEQADKNNIDWKMVAAISGVESTYGQFIPPYSYNAWGFGVYGDNVRRFTSWEDGIATVSTALRQDYMNKWKAQDVYEIGRIYAASPTWAVRVERFMNEIDAYREPKPLLISFSL